MKSRRNGGCDNINNSDHIAPHYTVPKVEPQPRYRIDLTPVMLGVFYTSSDLTPYGSSCSYKLKYRLVKIQRFCRKTTLSLGTIPCEDEHPFCPCGVPARRLSNSQHISSKCDRIHIDAYTCTCPYKLNRCTNTINLHSSRAYIRSTRIISVCGK